MESNKPASASAFAEHGFKATIRERMEVVKKLYLSDPIPWVIGYSGGKDSTATLQLVWRALSQLAPEQWHKDVHVISTDTLVENPIVAQWVAHSLEVMRAAAQEQGLPIKPHRLTPEVKDRFWVNLIGKGYPAPRPKFRWCTSRLKINPSNDFIKRLEQQNGEAIVVLGTRKAESAARAASMKRHEGSTREWLSRNGQLERSWVFTPVEEWTNDDVWTYLMQEKNPWGFNNSELLGMYQGATADGECPLVVDSSTPSCGDSRFGCYVCTMVSQDKSMDAMIQNDSEKEWMSPLLEFRNQFLGAGFGDDRKHREFRRMDGRLTLMPVANKDEDEDDVWEVADGRRFRLVHGPYKQSYRERLLRELLQAQRAVHDKAPANLKFDLLALEDLEEIRRIWVFEKHEIEDSVPRIYEEVMGAPYPAPRLDESQVFDAGDIELLREITSKEDDPDQLHFHLVRQLLAVEGKYQHAARRAGLFDELNSVLEYHAFNGEQEALEFAVHRFLSLEKANESVEVQFLRPMIPIIPIIAADAELTEED
ncbi:DNA phosphorothioation system sulfurtransferase DndC [Massilia sp. NEAU-DD11]|uniref:DNA phosphorothioation system sulfurtransferase DndC n=1 Tax=Massilia cellulosiltytica TaxID=2683234 RepID=A0A7X3G5T7_9BURK|nr:DNA phosphorothioation system sulfurtransferase DndC [Telluria cellulosilytica]MVW64164.1 DNA phosphorothioation system sulfurtransferase DndC [Telluria cellulosilytica]